MMVAVVGSNFDVGDVERSIADRFATQVERHGERFAVVTDAHEWTYNRLAEYSDQIVAAFLSLPPADPTAPIALLMQHDAPLIAAIVAAIRSGRPYVALDPTTDAGPRRQAAFELSGAAALLVDRANRHEGERLVTGRVEHVLIDCESCIAPSNAIVVPTTIASDAVASITFTSGSTGEPKGVCHSHRTVLHHCRNYTLTAQLCSDDRLTLLTPCSLAASRSALWGALLNGATLLPFDLRLHGINALPDWIRQRKPTVLHCVPTAFRTLVAVANGTDSFGSLRIVRLGGESIHAGDLELFRRCTRPTCAMYVGLSSTETGAVSCNVLNHDATLHGNRVPLGRPAVGMNVQLLDDAGQAVQPGEIGRIVVTSRYLAEGYWRDPQTTAARFGIDPNDSGVRSFDTGDLGRFDELGQLEHCGRADGRLKIRGHRVDPAVVERALTSIDGIHEAAVVAIEDAATEQSQLVAYIVSAEAADAPADRDVRTALRERLPDYMIPSRLVRLGALPRTAGGKIDRRGLSQLPSTPAAKEISRPSVNPHVDLESQIVAIWQQVLDRSNVGRHDDLFLDLGATSLQAATVVARIEKMIGRRIALTSLMQHRTPESLAKHISDQAWQSARSPVALVQVGASNRTPLFFVHGDVYGGGLYCPKLAKELGAEQPFYALAPLGFDRWPPPRSIEGMARRFVREIRKVQPRGPYLLGGFCNGGVIAFEMARRLQRAGEQTAMLALIRARVGAVPWPGFRRLVDGAADLVGANEDAEIDLYWRVHDHLQRWRGASRNGFRGRLKYAPQMLARLKGRLIDPDAGPGEAVRKPDFSGRTSTRADRIMNVHRRAARAYLPASYGGRAIVLWPAEELALLKGDETAGWRRFARDVDSRLIPGGHATCVTTHINSLAQVLRGYIAEANNQLAGV
jgi:acyl-coenzyme A synthetase/AMP-(fatty) acid ligase/thioesterase domain-containing protein/acyl carrier protein